MCMYQATELAELKRETDMSSITVMDFDAGLTVIDRTTRQHISKDMEELNNTISQILTEFCADVCQLITRFLWESKETRIAIFFNFEN